MSPQIASALRRAAIAGGALAASLLGHAVAVGGAEILPVAPLLWLGVLSLVILSGAARRSAGTFQAWGPLRLLGVLLAGQAGLHLLLHAAPWALGLGVHHTGAALITTSAIVVHLLLSLILLAALCVGQTLLLRALAIARALFARRRPPAPARPSAALPRDVWLATSQWRHDPRSSRGPPAPALPRTGYGLRAAAFPR
jgi:hypothetical protein